MDSREDGLDRLLGQWRRMSSDDRRAIMEGLSNDSRAEFEALLGADGNNGKSADRQYFLYSGWLGALIEASASDTYDVAGPAGSLKSPVKAALHSAHERLVPQERANLLSIGALTRARKAFSDWMADR